MSSAHHVLDDSLDAQRPTKRARVDVTPAPPEGTDSSAVDTRKTLVDEEEDDEEEESGRGQTEVSRASDLYLDTVSPDCFTNCEKRSSEHLPTDQ